VRVRKALLLSIDREYLSSVLFNGTRLPAVSYVGRGFPGGTSDADFRTEGGDLFATDVDQAKELLTEAGYPDGDGFPVLEIAYSNNPNNTLICEYLQACWEDLGLTVSLSSIEPAAMTELRDAGNFDITPQGWGADYFDASNMLSIFITGNFINAGRYSSETFDKLYNDSMVEIDNVKRIRMLLDAEKTLVVDDAAIIPLFHSSSYAIYDEAVCANVTINANGKVMLTKVVVTK
jgi:oligopeptide transport system substrate-binding protein